jgi:hypothetical protein
MANSFVRYARRGHSSAPIANSSRRRDAGDDQGWPQLCGHPPGLGLDGSERGGMLASKMGALKRYTALAASTYIRSGQPPVPRSLMQRARGWGSKEDGTHLLRGVLQPRHEPITHPPWKRYIPFVLTALLFTLESRAFRHEIGLEIAPLIAGRGAALNWADDVAMRSLRRALSCSAGTGSAFGSILRLNGQGYLGVVVDAVGG